MRVLAFLFAAFITQVCAAQFTSTNGPINTQGQCWSLWADGATAFMGFNENLYRTTDGGASWELLNNGIPEGCDPRTIESANGVLVVGTNDNQRLYLSNNGGDSWTGSSSNPLLIPTASAVAGGNHFIGGTLNEPSAVDPTTGDLTPTGAGGTLTHALNHVGENEVWQSAGSVFSSVTRFSTDAGATWTTLTEEPQIDIGGGIISAAIPQDFVRCGDRIIAGTNLVGFPVIYSDDNGASWTPSNLPSTTWSDYGKRFIKVSDDHLLTTNLSGLWKSTDQGATWTLIQEISEVRTMVAFNGDHVLVGTDQGVCEFANYGEGELVAKHGAVGGTASLVVQNDQVWTSAAGALQAYDAENAVWNIAQNVDVNGNGLPTGAISIVGDSVFIAGAQLAAAHVDNLEFTLRSGSSFAFQTLTTLAGLGGVKLAGTENGFQAGKIFRSTDDGVTYTEATFSNNVSFGYGGLSGNHVQRFHQAGNALWADMNAGYAVSTDDGQTWTFYGGTWDDSYLTVVNNVIYRYNFAGLDPAPRSLTTSSDNGVTWDDVPLDGIPGSEDGAFMGFYGVYSVNDVLHTHHFDGEVPGVYSWSGTAWSLVEGTSGAPAEEVLALVSTGDALFGAWAQAGVWQTGAGDVSIDEHVFDAVAYPNPACDAFHLSSGVKLLSVTDINGQRQHVEQSTNGRVDVSALPMGVYLVHVLDGDHVGTLRLLVQR